MNLSQLMPDDNMNVQYWAMCLYKKITQIIVGFFDCMFVCTQLFFVELTSTSEKVKITSYWLDFSLQFSTPTLITVFK